MHTCTEYSCTHKTDLQIKQLSAWREFLRQNKMPERHRQHSLWAKPSIWDHTDEVLWRHGLVHANCERNHVFFFDVAPLEDEKLVVKDVLAIHVLDENLCVCVCVCVYLCEWLYVCACVNVCSTLWGWRACCARCSHRPRPRRRYISTEVIFMYVHMHLSSKPWVVAQDVLTAYVLDVDTCIHTLHTFLYTKSQPKKFCAVVNLAITPEIVHTYM